MKIIDIVNNVHLGNIALPKFQRAYVWNRDQVRGLMHSLYRKYPVGSLLVWVTSTGGAKGNGGGHNSSVVQLLLDGQQRVTTLYGIIRGEAPPFFNGNSATFTGLYFNLEEENFEFYAPQKMMNNPLWIDVTDLMKYGVGKFIPRLVEKPELQAKLGIYVGRLSSLEQIKDIDLHIEQVTGEDKTVEVVVDIFNKVNSGGTKLSKGDLALAKVCAGWPEARDAMEEKLKKWEKAGFNFEMEWLLRVVNVVLTGEALFSALKDVDTATFKDGLKKSEHLVGKLLDIIASRLGLDHGRVLGSRYAFPLMAYYLNRRGGVLKDYREQDKLLYWYVHTLLWGRYAGATESVLNQDLELVRNPDGAIDRLIGQLRQNRGDLRVHPDDFTGYSRNARFYPMLYMLTRVCHARDLLTGVELSNYLLGHLSQLDVHHIFPKALLYRHGYAVSEVNAIANLTFLTKESDIKISDSHPAEYLSESAKSHPGAIESNWIPNDRELWKVENYRQFLAARRELLAKAANDFLDSLLGGSLPKREVTSSVLERTVVSVPGGLVGEEEERIIQDFNQWITEQGLPEGKIAYELIDPNTNEPVAILDLAWPNGLQEHYSQPVALLLNETKETEEAANTAGFRFFTNIEDFRAYVRREVLAMEEAPI